MIPKDLSSIQTNMSPMDFYTMVGVLEEHQELISYQPTIEFEGSLIIKFYYGGLAYQMIKEYGLLVSLMRL